MTGPGEDYVSNDHLDPDQRGPETPAADAVEQATPADPFDQPVETLETHAHPDVNEYDAVEQTHPVDVGDEY
jgi:hypothetical protein